MRSRPSSFLRWLIGLLLRGAVPVDGFVWCAGACLTNERRREGDPQRADFRDRVAPHSTSHVSERIAERCRCGSAAAGDH
jgi:hypothetical protein